MRKKEGQVTIFIALGLIILLVIGLTIYYREELFRTDWEKERSQSLSVPQKAKNAQDIVLSCFTYTLDQAITKLGMQGGFINISEDPIPETPANPFSNALRIFPNKDFRVTYWYYMTANGIEKSNIPTKSNMEKELAAYVDSNIGDCIRISGLFDAYNITLSNPKTAIQIKDKSVLLTSQYSLTLREGGFVFNIPKFYVKSNAQLGRLHNIAKEIIRNNNKVFYLEDKTIDILVANDELPYTGTETTCKTKIWTKSKVNKDFKNIVSKNIPYIKIKGTDFIKRTDYFVWDALSTRNSDINVNFKFSENWPTKIDIEPSEGELLISKPLLQGGNEAVAFLRAFFCLNDYNFIYDIKYPVLITLTGPSGFTLQLATQVIIDNNQPHKNTLGNLSFPEQKDKICTSPVNKINVYTLTADDSGLLKDTAGVQINFKCVNTACNMGATKIDSEGYASLNKKFPACANALITGAKQGYHTARETVSTTKETDVNLVLEKYTTLGYNIELFDMAYRQPTTSETVVIQLNEPNLKYSTSIAYPSDKETITLLPGTYDVTAYVMEKDSSGITIKGKEIKHCTKTPMKSVLGIFGLTETDCSKTKVPDMTITEVIKSGTKFTWTVPRNSLFNSKNVTFYLPAGKLPKDYTEISKVFEGIEKNKNIIYPKIG